MFYLDLLEQSSVSGDNFISTMHSRYATEIPPVHDLNEMFAALVKSDIRWSTHSAEEDDIGAVEKHLDQAVSKRYIKYSANGSLPSSMLTGHMIDADHTDGNISSHGDMEEHHHHTQGHSIEEDIAHGFHKASITILAILAVEVGFSWNDLSFTFICFFS